MMIGKETIKVTHEDQYLRVFIRYLVVFIFSISLGLGGCGEKESNNSTSDKSTSDTQTNNSSTSTSGTQTSSSTPTSGTQPSSCDPSNPSQPLRVNHALAVDPSNDAIVYVGIEGKGGVFKTTDSGATWSRIVTGIRYSMIITGTTQPCYNEFKDLSISETNPKNICIIHGAGPFSSTEASFGKYMGPYCSADAGATWSRKVDANVKNVGGYALTIDPENENTVYFGVGDDIYSGNQLASTGIIYKSTDFGTTWTELNTLYISGESTDRIVIDPVNHLLYAAMSIMVKQGTGVNGSRFSATQYGILKSADGGQTWSYKSNGMSSADPSQKAIHYITLSRKAPKYLLAMNVSDNTSPYFYVSKDQAETFSTATNSGQMLDIAEFAPNTSDGLTAIGYSYASGRILKTTNGGMSWIPLTTPPESTVRISAFAWSHQDSNKLYMGGSYGTVYRSTDGGATWAKVLSSDTLPQ